MQRYILITGGAGFIGTNIARSYLARDEPVHIFDNLSRAGTDRNIAELQRCYPNRVCFTHADVSDAEELRQAVHNAKAVYHLAAQVAVTTSLNRPIDDFHTNVVGTLNLLEAIRRAPSQPALLFTSTNKVYGKLGSIVFRKTA